MDRFQEEQKNSEFFTKQKDEIIQLFNVLCPSKDKERLCKSFFSKVIFTLPIAMPCTEFLRKYGQGHFEDDEIFQKEIKILMEDFKPKTLSKTTSVSSLKHAAAQLDIEAIKEAIPKIKSEENFPSLNSILQVKFRVITKFKTSNIPIKALKRSRCYCLGSNGFVFLSKKSNLLALSRDMKLSLNSSSNFQEICSYSFGSFSVSSETEGIYPNKLENMAILTSSIEIHLISTETLAILRTWRIHSYSAKITWLNNNEFAVADNYGNLIGFHITSLDPTWSTASQEEEAKEPKELKQKFIQYTMDRITDIGIGKDESVIGCRKNGDIFKFSAKAQKYIWVTSFHTFNGSTRSAYQSTTISFISVSPSKKYVAGTIEELPLVCIFTEEKGEFIMKPWRTPGFSLPFNRLVSIEWFGAEDKLLVCGSKSVCLVQIQKEGENWMGVQSLCWRDTSNFEKKDLISMGINWAKNYFLLGDAGGHVFKCDLA